PRHGFSTRSVPESTSGAETPGGRLMKSSIGAGACCCSGCASRRGAGAIPGGGVMKPWLSSLIAHPLSARSGPGAMLTHRDRYSCASVAVDTLSEIDGALACGAPRGGMLLVANAPELDALFGRRLG